MADLLSLSSKKILRVKEVGISEFGRGVYRFDLCMYFAIHSVESLGQIRHIFTIFFLKVSKLCDTIQEVSPIAPMFKENIIQLFYSSYGSNMKFLEQLLGMTIQTLEKYSSPYIFIFYV